jgi:hypothetical protein
MHLTKAAHRTRSSGRIHGRILLPTVYLAGAVACGVIGPSSARAADTPAPAESSVERPSPLVGGWLEQLVPILQLLLQLIGGDPESLSDEPYTAMAQVTAHYSANGCPADLSELEKAEGKVLVETAWLLSNPLLVGNDPAVSGLRRTLKKLYADLGGNPNFL